MQDLIDAAKKCKDKMLVKYFSRLNPDDLNKTMYETRLVGSSFSRYDETPLSYVHARSKCYIRDKTEDYEALFDLIVQKGGMIGCRSVLYSAINKDDFPLFQRILEVWDLDKWDIESAMLTVVRHAYKPMHVEMARILLDKGADPNSLRLEKTLIDEARYPDLIRLLVSRGADVAFRYKNGNSILESHSISSKKMLLLLELSSDPVALLNSTDPYNGKTLLYKTLKSVPFEDLVLKPGHGHFKWSSEEEDEYDRRLESYSENVRSRLDHIRTLVRMGADPLIKTKKGKTCRDISQQVCDFLDSI